MKPIIAATFIFAAAAVFLFAGCNDDNATDPDGSIRISGEVRAYICAPDDPRNDTIHPRYAVETGRLATLEFASPDYQTFAPIQRVTNDSSEFSVELMPGYWSITVTTDHTNPDAFDSVYIDQDEYFDIGIRYDFADPDSVVVAFTYALGPPGPVYGSPLQPGQEREYIDTLNARIGNYLLPDSARTYSLETNPGTTTSVWISPIVQNRRMWIVAQALRVEMEDDYYPAGMNAGPRVFGLCPDDFELWPGPDFSYPDSMIPEPRPDGGP